jgi:uncharacterized protein (DUF2344 family)
MNAGILRDFGGAQNDGFADERLMDLQQKIDREYKLLADHEQLLEMEKDPRKIMEMEDKIEEINAKITKYEEELKLVPGQTHLKST